MPTGTVRTLISFACLAWLVVGGYGLWGIVVEDSGDNWETPYLVFAIALFLGAVLNLAAVWIVSQRDERSPMRVIGLGVCGVGLLSTVVACAIPVWMTLLATGYALIAVSGVQPWRRPVAFLAAAQLLGMAAMFVGIAAEVGRRDEYGDHPAAFGIGIVVTAVATVVSLYQLDRSSTASVPSPALTVGAGAL